MIADELIRQFDKRDEVREFPFGRFEIVRLNGVAFGRATYEPGWKWSLHNAPIVGTALCHAPHIGVAISGHGVVQYQDGTRTNLFPGTVFNVTDQPHDSWVEGDAPCVSIHLPKWHCGRWLGAPEGVNSYGEDQNDCLECEGQAGLGC